MSFLDDGPDVDFDDMYNVWLDVAKLEELVANQQSIMDITRAAFKKSCLENQEFWPLGKPPSMEYLKQVVHYVGNTKGDGESLDDMERDLLKYRKKLTEAKGTLDVMHEKLRIFQTKSANARKSLVVE